MAADLPTAAAVTSGTVTNAQQKTNFGALLDFVLGYLGAKFGIGPQTVASAATLNLEAVTDTRDLVISGATPITAVTIEAGKVFRCRASGAFTLTNNADIVTQTGANIVCAAGDTFMVRGTAVNKIEVLNFTRAVLAVKAVNFDSGQTGAQIAVALRGLAFFDGTLVGSNAPTMGFGVTTIDRTGTGIYTVTIPTAGSANYAVTITVGDTTNQPCIEVDTRTTTTFRVICTRRDNGAVQNIGFGSIMIGY